MLARHMFGYIRPYRYTFWAGTLARAFGDTASLIPAFVISEIINTFSGGVIDISRIRILLIIWLIAICTRVVSQHYAKVRIYSMEEKIRKNIELNYLRTALSLDTSWHEKENTGNKFKRIVNGSESVKKIIHIWVVNLIEILVSFVGILIIFFSYDKTLTLFGVIYIITTIVFSYLLNVAPARAAKRVNEVDEETTGLYFEVLSNVRTVKVLNLAVLLLQRVKKVAEERYIRIKKRIVLYQVRSQIISLWGALCRFSGAIYCIVQIWHGQQEIGFLVLFMTYFNRLWEMVTELSEVSPEIVVAKQQIARMRESFHDVPLTNPNETEVFPKEWNKIEVTDMSFSYGAEDVLKNISFDVKKGEKVGIVGLSGAGKSTLFKLLLKERVPTHGSVSVEGVSIDTIKNDSYLANVSVVLQDTEVFNMTLRENIEIVRSDADSDTETLERALTVSHVADFLHKLPEGVETVIGEKGVKLSGGERQRLGIARAIYKNPDILLMDEATSHLDIESEKKIQASLHEFFQDVTAIVIAHRLTTIKEMDKILVIEEGKIVESGSFKELTKKKGRFFELWEKQQL